MMEEKDKIHIPFEDDFALSIRQKLEGHRFSPEDDDWENMEFLLKQNRQRRKRTRMVWLSSVAAAMLVFVCLIPFISREEPVFYEASQPSVTVPDTGKPETPVVNGPIVQENTFIAEVKTEKKKAPSTPEKRELREEPQVEPVDEKPVKTKDKKEFLELPDPYEPPLVVTKKRRKWQLGVGAFTVGTMDMGLGDGNDMLHSDGGYWNGTDPTNPGEEGEEGQTKAGYTQIQQLIEQEEYYNTSHSIPFSVGISARKELGHGLAVETGLVYTYLSSEFSKTGSSSYSYAKTKQHYIGIPLNLVWTAAQQNNFSFYLSGGVMIEKGIRINLLKKVWTKQELYETKVSSGIGGVQVSFQFVPGIAYAFTKDWSLYVEPRFSCYFNNNQPTSIRTENTCVIGIGGGFRYTF